MSDGKRRIHSLSETLILKMAAGEVVERPASVVKELVENSVDSGAGRIEIRIEKAGLDVISVSDDGCGIEPDDIRLALSRHATSKISSFDDLFNVNTMGFRGEALASIAAVSRLEMTSRTHGSALGARILSEGGKIIEEGSAGAPVGTCVNVSELFFNVPVRKKFLKSPQTEMAKIIESVERIALGFPRIHFSLFNGARKILDFPISKDLGERAVQVFGEISGGRVFSAEGIDGDMRLNVIFCPPEISRRDMSSVFIIVNGRHVIDRGIRRIVSDAFKPLIPDGRFPLAVADFKIPFSEVDVNVHPQKSEVRFSSNARVYGFLSKTLTGAVASSPWLAGKSYKISSDSLKTFNQSGLRSGARYQPPSVLADMSGEGIIFSPESRYPETIRPLDFSETAGGFFSSMIFRGQLWSRFLVCESLESLVLIDQHAAAERIAFNKLMDSRHKGSPSVQMLLSPMEISLSPSHFALMERHRGTLDSMGFVTEEFGDKTIIVRGLPALVKDADPKVLLADVIDELELTGKETSLEKLVENIASRIACHSVIRGAHPLSAMEAEYLLKELDTVDFKAVCPHGRPVFYEIKRYEIERKLGRI